MEAKRVSERVDTDASAGYKITIAIDRLHERLSVNREFARTATSNRTEPLVRAVRDPILASIDKAMSLLAQAEDIAQEASAHLDEAVELLRDASGK